MYYLIVRSLVLPERELRAGDLLHLSPFLLGLATWGSAWFGIDDHQRLFRFGFDSEFPVLEFMAFKALVLYSYFIGACRLLLRASRDASVLYAGRHRVDPKILLRITLALGCIPAIIYVISAIGHLGYAPNLNSDQIGGLLLVGIIFSVAWLLMFRPWVLSLKAGEAASGRWKREANSLAAFLDEEKPWLEPDLRSADVANSMNWTESNLSSVIKHGMNTSFHGLLNSYRLAEFDRLVRAAGSQSRDVLAIALDAGFGSKAAFYRAFKEAHDMTPSQYRNSILQSALQETSQ